MGRGREREEPLPPRLCRRRRLRHPRVFCREQLIRVPFAKMVRVGASRTPMAFLIFLGDFRTDLRVMCKFRQVAISFFTNRCTSVMSLCICFGTRGAFFCRSLLQ